MPLDNSRQVEARLEATKGFRSAYTHKDNTLSPLTGLGEEVSQAEAVYAVWMASASFPAADFLMLRFDDVVAVASKRAGLVILGEKTLNAGMLRLALKDLPVVPVPDMATAQSAGWSAEQRTIWALAERFGRVEAPRTFELVVGDYEYVLEVRPNAFAIVDEDGGVARFLEKVSLAAQNEAAVEYTLGEPKERNEHSNHNIVELFGESETGGWAFENDWPVSVPAGASFSDIRLATALQKAVSAVSDNAVRAEILDASGQTFLSVKAQSGSGTLSWHA